MPKTRVRYQGGLAPETSPSILTPQVPATESLAPPVFLPIFQELSRGVGAARARNSNARMGAGATEIQALERCAVGRPAEERPQAEELIERQLSVKNMSSSQPQHVLKITRCDHLAVKNQGGQIGSVTGKRLHHRVAERLPLLRPVAVPQFVRSELRVNRHHVLTGRCEFGIRKRWDHRLEVRLTREFTVFGGIESALQVINLWSDVNTSGECRCSIADVL